MAIGDVRASGGLELQKVSDRAGRVQQQGLAQLNNSASNLIKAGMGYLESEQRLNQMYNDRARKSTQLHIETELMNWRRDRGQEYADFVRERSASPLGMTNDYADHLEAQTEAFLESVPAPFREEYAAKMRQDNAQRVSSAYISEISAMEAVDKARVEESLNTLGSALRGKTVTLEDAEEQLAEIIGLTSLAPIDQEAMVRSGRSVLQSLEFGDIIETASRGFGVATDDWSGRDVVAAGMAPEQRAVLNAISSREAGSYDVWNGGARFEGYADHPAAFGKAPGASTAAGRYQFTYGTWKTAKASFERTFGVAVPDFSPEWQDRVADHWAEVIFNRWNGEGLDYKQVLMSGDPSQIVKIRRVLGNPKDPSNPNSVEWEGWADRSFRGNSEAADRAFLEAMMGERGIAGGGTGAPELPNVWTDERYADMTLDDKLRVATNAWSVSDQWRKEEAARQRALIESFNDQMYELGYSSGNLDSMFDYMENPMWSNEAERMFRKGVKENVAKQTSMGEMQSLIDSGGRVPKGQMGAYGEWFGEENYRGVASGDSEALNKLAYGYRQTGTLPPDLAKVYREGMADPAARAKVAELFASIHAGTPGALTDAGFTPRDLVDLKAFQTIASATSPENTEALWAQRQDRIDQSGKTAAQLEKEAARSWTEGGGNDKLFRDLTEDSFGGVFWRWTPHQRENLITTQGRQMFDREAFEYYQQGMLIYGNEDEALDFAKESMGINWGLSYSQVSQDGGRLNPRLMKYAPERYYAPENGEDDYGYLYREALDLVMENSPDGVEFLAGSTRLVPDRQTEQEAGSGEPPTYLVVAETVDGQLVTLPERFGGKAIAEIGAMGSLEAEGQKVFESEYRALTRTHTETVMDMTGGGVLRGEMEPGELSPDSEAWQERQQTVEDLERRIRATEDAAIEAGFVDPAKVDRERERRETLRRGRGVESSPVEVTPAAYGAGLAAYHETLLSGSLDEDALAYGVAREALDAMWRERPVEPRAAELWDRQMILRAMAEGTNLVELLSDPQLVAFGGDVVPREWTDAAVQFQRRLGERSQSVGERLTRQVPGITENEVKWEVMFGLASSWAGFGPGEAADIVDAILEGELN